MSRLRRFSFRLLNFLRPQRAEPDLARELASHLALAEDEFRHRGMTPDEARLAARRALGGIERAKALHRDARSLLWLEDVRRDVRHAARSLARSPGFTAVAVLTLALGIGANTAIFSIVNSLLLRNLPVAEPERLVTISSPTAIEQGRTAGWTYPIWNQIRQRTRLFEGAAAWSLPQRFNLAQGGEVEQVDGFYASGEFFETLGVSTLMGRTLSLADDVRGGGADGPVTVISYPLWQQRFGQEAGVIGRSIVIEQVPFTIIGVTPPGFFGAEVGQAFDVVLPIGTEPLIRGRDTLLDGRGYWLRVMLRLKSGQSLDAATATLRGVQPQIREAALPPNLPTRFQQDFLKEPFALVSAFGSSRLRHQYDRPLLTVFGITALVLLVACANIANLLLARGTARRHDLSVRLALGAPRWRLARQLLVESFVLAAVGASVGLAVAPSGSRLVVAQLSNYFDHVFLDVSLDWNVMIFTVTITLVTAALFGTLPAFRATRVAPLEPIKPERGGNSGRDGTILSSGLVVAQVSFSLVLVVTAGLFVQTLARLANLPVGFDTERVLIVYTDMTRVPIDPADRVPFYDRLVGAVGAVPGVAHAAVSMVTPVSGLSMRSVVEAPGAPEASERERTVLINYITPGWFATYGIPLRAGRDINAGDTPGAPPVLVVNDAFVRRFFSGRGAIDGTVFDPRDQASVRKTVIGVVGNAIYRSVREDVQPTLYAPLAQLNVAPASFSISVRSSGPPPVALQRDIAAALNAVDRNLAFSFLPLVDQIDASLTEERLVAMLSGFFGALALLLAALGLYGVTSYAVTRRQTEIGIRMALGARRADVIRLVLRQNVVTIAVGLLLGLAGAAAVTRYLEGMLFGVTPLDPTTFVAVSVMFAAVATVASYVPARRATKVDPLLALRWE